MEHTHHGFVWRKTYGDVEIPNAIKLTRADFAHMRTQICGLRVVMSEHVNTLPHFSFENVSKLIEAMKTLLSACEDIADFNLIIPRTAELTIDEGIQSAVVRIHADLTHNVSVDDNMNHILFTLRYQPTETSSEFAISVESATLADKRYVLSLPLAIDDSLSYGIAFPIPSILQFKLYCLINHVYANDMESSEDA